jgi:hypothetical protein
MCLLDSLRLLTKPAVPVTIFIAITIGLIGLARTDLEMLVTGTQEFVERDAARLRTILQLNASPNEATIRQKSILARRAVDVRPTHAAYHEDGKRVTIKDINAPMTPASMPDTWDAYESLESLVLSYFAPTDQSVAMAARAT